MLENIIRCEPVQLKGKLSAENSEVFNPFDARFSVLSFLF